MTAPEIARKPSGTALRGFGTTLRMDRWSVESGIVGLVFTGFIIYSLISSLLLTPAVLGVSYEADGYLSPFFSPLLVFPFLPARWFSPAILILWIPLGFRTTCYYYRKAYYRAFFFDPPACAVGEPPSTAGTRWRRASRSSSRTSTGSSCTWPSSRSRSCGSTRSLSFRYQDQFRIGLGGAGPARQRGAADRLLALLPLAAAPGRRPARLLLLHGADPGPLRDLAATHVG